MRTKFARRAVRRRAFACCGSKRMIPSPRRLCCKKKTRKRRSKSATERIILGHDDSCPFSVSACVTLLSHENYAPTFCLHSSPCSARFFVCRRINRQARCKSQVSRFRWDVHEQNGEQGNLRVRV